MRFLPFAGLLLALAVTPTFADEKKPGGDKPEPGSKGQPGSVVDDEIVRLKHELEELKRLQTELTRKAAALAEKIKDAEERTNGSARLTANGVLKKDGPLFYVPFRMPGGGQKDLENRGARFIPPRTADKGERRVYVVGTAEQLKPLAALEGKLVTVSGDLVLNPTDPLHHAAANFADKYFGVPAGEMGVIHFTIDEQRPSEGKKLGNEK